MLCWQPPKPTESDSVQRSVPLHEVFVNPLIAVLEQHLTSCFSLCGAQYGVSLAEAFLPRPSSWHSPTYKSLVSCTQRDKSQHREAEQWRLEAQQREGTSQSEESGRYLHTRSYREYPGKGRSMDIMVVSVGWKDLPLRTALNCMVRPVYSTTGAHQRIYQS